MIILIRIRNLGRKEGNRTYFLRRCGRIRKILKNKSKLSLLKKASRISAIAKIRDDNIVSI